MDVRIRMRVGFLVSYIGILMCAALLPLRSSADGLPSMQLVISQFKVTSSDGQFFTLYNPSTTTSLDLSTFQLQYFNNIDLTKATSSKILPLSGTVPPQGYYMVSDGAAIICYQLTVDTVSLGFSTTSGFLEVVQMPVQSTPGALISPSISDYVGWSKSTSKGNDTVSVSNPNTSITIPSTTIQWYRKLGASLNASTWQSVRPDPANACNLQIVQSGGTFNGTTPSNPGNQLTVGPQPPATIISLASTGTANDPPSLPLADIGLSAPQVSELLPNPVGSGNDAVDEFIELYNPNAVPFDLSGFTLQTGVTTKHSYVFPDGTSMPANGFVAYYSSDTGLSLSNTSGAADLLDPFGNTLSQTDGYGTAKDGQSWTLAKGKWYWTSQPTPNAANIIKQVAATTSKKSKSTKTVSSATGTTHGVQGAATTSATNASSADATQQAPLHPLMLAVVVVLAVGYGIYEYRHDIANKIHELRRNRSIRRAARV